MRRVLGNLLALALALAGLIGADLAAAEPTPLLRPLNLRVLSGEDGWHADNDFRLDWDRPPLSEGGAPITAVHFRIRDAAGSVALADTLPWDTTQLENLHLPFPFGPGIYSADVWLDGGGLTGTPASTTLRFDDARPGVAGPLVPAGWVAGSVAAVVRIEHPSGPLPISGIRGYAVSVDRGGGSAPCAGPDRCRLAETDLRGGIGADTISLGVLPEGMHVVRAVAVSGAGLRSPESMSAIVRVDATAPGVTLDGVPRGWAAGPVRVTARAADPLSGMNASGPDGPFTAIALDGGLPRTEPGPTVSALVVGEGPHGVAAYARDAAGNLGEESPTRATVRIDESPPRIAFANSQVAADPERIEATVSDVLSGPDPSRGSIAVRPTGSRRPFTPLPTTVAGPRLLARWDSDSYPAGSYEFRATAYDSAGNQGSSDRRADGARMVLANPLKTPTTIAARFPKGETAIRPYGRGIFYAGRLKAAGGSPPGRQQVEIVETFAAGADPGRRTTTVETAADGSFRAHLPRARAAASASSSLEAGPWAEPEAARRACGYSAACACMPPPHRPGSAVPRSSSAAASTASPRRSRPPAGRFSCSSASPATPGRSSAPCRPTPAATSATPTPSATTTAAASASSSAPSPPLRTTGRTSQRARGPFSSLAVSYAVAKATCSMSLVTLPVDSCFMHHNELPPSTSAQETEPLDLLPAGTSDGVPTSPLVHEGLVVGELPQRATQVLPRGWMNPFEQLSVLGSLFAPLIEEN